MAEQKNLTEREQQRIKMIDGITADLAQKGYIRENVTITALKANQIAILWVALAIILFGGGYFIRNGFQFSHSIWASVVVMVLVFVSFAVHELIHGAVWAIFAPNHFKYVEFGFLRSSCTPYCTCKEPLKKSTYIIGLIMPFLLLGVIPCLVGIFGANASCLFFGLVAILGAGGDLTIIWKMLTYKTDCRDVIIMDHPAEIGFIVFKKYAS